MSGERGARAVGNLVVQPFMCNSQVAALERSGRSGCFLGVGLSFKRGGIEAKLRTGNF
jgi:hypothetical protein